VGRPIGERPRSKKIYSNIGTNVRNGEIKEERYVTEAEMEKDSYNIISIQYNDKDIMY